MNKPLNEKIAELRKARSLTQEKLGEQLGITSQAVSRWEKGETMPDIMLLPQLCEILGVSIDALLEMPSNIKKDNLMKDLSEYAKTEGCNKAIYEAFDACTSDIDESMVNGSSSVSYDGIRVFTKSGLGIILYKEDIISKVQNTDEKRIKEICELFSDARILAVIKALNFSEFYSEDEIAKKTNLPLSDIEQVLFKLIKLKFCDCDTDNAYSFGSDAYILFSILSGIYLTTKEGHTAINSRSRNFPNIPTK